MLITTLKTILSVLVGLGVLMVVFGVGKEKGSGKKRGRESYYDYHDLSFLRRR